MNHFCSLLASLAFFTSSFSWAQANLPDDFLSPDFHKERREKLREKLPENSVAVFFASAIRNRSNDVDYIYHQDPNFFYLTGYREPHAVLLLFKEDQKASNGVAYNEILFVQPRNVTREMWTGKRLGAKGTKEVLGFKEAFPNGDFEKYNVDFSKFDQVLFYDFMNDVRNEVKDSTNVRNKSLDGTNLYALIKSFKKKINYPVQGQIKVAPEKGKSNLNIVDLDDYMQELRGLKTKEELDMIRQAVRISCQGQIEVMKAMKPGMSEREIQGIHEFVFKKYQAENVGYPSIVGAGHNGCILHYIDNYRPEITSKELILMDLGAEYHGYTADITRTIPVSGKFSEDQKAIYNIVLAAQEAAMKICKVGTTFGELLKATRKTVNAGLKELGLIKTEDEKHTYYPHGCCHHIGLDVHDKGLKNALQENMTFTIEPGIYIPKNSKCDKRWWDIAIRIEDDFRATQNGCEHLSSSAPRSVEGIEALMKETSPLDNFTLPELKKDTQ